MTSLAALCELIVDCEHKTAPTVPSGFPLIRTPDIQLGRLDVKGARRVDEATYREWTKRAVPRPGDLILAREAPVGNVGPVPPGAAVALGQRTVLIRTRPDVLDPMYLNYLLSGPQLRARMDGVASGATVPHLNVADIRSMELSHLPPLSVQRKVAAILSAYDDMVDNYHRRIEILEEMAQRIYREWFIDFRFPGHEEVHLVDSDVGRIPCGWVVQPLAEVLAFHIGGGWGTDARDVVHSAPADVIRGTDLARVSHFELGTCPARFHTQSNLKSRLLQAGDLVLEVSGGSADQPVGRSILFSAQHVVAFGANVICASFCKLLRPKSAVLTSELLHLHFCELYDTREVETYQVQSTGIKNLRFAQLLQNDRLVVPPTALQRCFNALVVPILEEVRLIARASTAARASRGILIPRLISGEIALEDVDVALPDLAA